MKVKELIEILKNETDDDDDFNIEVFAEVIKRDGKTLEKQVEVGELELFDVSFFENKIWFKFTTCVDLEYHDLA